MAANDATVGAWRPGPAGASVDGPSTGRDPEVLGADVGTAAPEVGGLGTVVGRIGTVGDVLCGLVVVDLTTEVTTTHRDSARTMSSTGPPALSGRTCTSAARTRMLVVPGPSMTICWLSTAVRTPGTEIWVFGAAFTGTVTPASATPVNFADPCVRSGLAVQELVALPAVTRPPAIDALFRAAVLVSDGGATVPTVDAEALATAASPGTLTTCPVASMGPNPAEGGVASASTPPGVGGRSGAPLVVTLRPKAPPDTVPSLTALAKPGRPPLPAALAGLPTTTTRARAGTTRMTARTVRRTNRRRPAGARMTATAA